MVAASPPPPPPPNFRGDLKILDQNNWAGGPEQNIKFGWKLNLTNGGPKILGGPKKLNDDMVIVLKDILLC